jgi:hypothetical protein
VHQRLLKVGEQDITSHAGEKEGSQGGTPTASAIKSRQCFLMARRALSPNATPEQSACPRFLGYCWFDDPFEESLYLR